MDFEVEATEDGGLRVTRKGKASGPVRVACVQEGEYAAWRERLTIPEGEEAVVFAPVIGNGGPVRVTVSGPGVVPLTKEVPDPVRARVTEVAFVDGHLRVALDRAETPEVRFPRIETPAPRASPLSRR